MHQLEFGKDWAKHYVGKHMLKAYANWFGVDKICAKRNYDNWVLK